MVSAGSASCADMHEALVISKAFMAAGSAFQAGAARVIAQAERHGDGGTQVLADAAGMPRREAHNQVKTARVIEAVPVVRDAVESGRVSQANAKRLAEAVERTSADDVAADGDLLAKAASMRPEQFAREARRWAADHDGDSGASEHHRQRAKRCVRIWDGDDGLVHLRGQFDAVTGRRITNRLRAEAGRLHGDDKKQGGDTERRSFDQCMADALDNLTSGTGAGGGKPFADICVVAHVDDATGELIAELPDGERLPKTMLEQLACNAKLTGVVYDRKGKTHLAHPIAPHRHRGPMAAAHRQMGWLFPLRRQSRNLPGPPHRTSLTRRTHQTRQPRPSLLELPPQNPPRQLANSQEPRWLAHPAPTRPNPTNPPRTRPRPRPSTANAPTSHRQSPAAGSGPNGPQQSRPGCARPTPACTEPAPEPAARAALHARLALRR